ncbi:MAG: hypothetical protein ACPIOQ_36690 [Promethearchaeia archaeon]
MARLTGPSLSQAYQDNHLRTELNVKSGGALEPEPTALHLLQVSCCVLPSCMAVWQCAKGAGTGLGCRRWVESGGAQARDWQGSASRRELLVTKSLGAPWAWTMQVGQARPVAKQADAVVWAL